MIDPKSHQDTKKILFGATIVVCDENDKKKVYQIVGVDEADAASGKISWVSPLAKALLGKNQGDFFEFKSPKGALELDIVEVRYE